MDINLLINLLSLINFDNEFDKENIQLIKTANKMLADDSLDKKLKNSLLAALKDFPSTDVGEAHNISSKFLKDPALFVKDKEFILNEFQIKVMEKIYKRGNHSISMPTSSGKSFMIRKFIKKNIEKFSKIIVIVPTNALANEYISRLKSSDIEAHESFGKGKVFILTQERASGINSLPRESIIFIDEAYEMSDTKNERNILTAHLLHKFLKFDIYGIKLFSPNIKNPLSLIPEGISESFIPYTSNYSITSRNVDITTSYDCFKKINKDESTIVFIKKQNAIKKVVYSNEFKPLELDVKGYDEIFEFLNQEYGDILYIELLKKGIALHNGDTPKPIRLIQELMFKAGIINIMFATTTITQGINLKSQNLIIYEKVGGNFTKFNFRNLIGRVGRYEKDNFSVRTGKVIVSDDIKNIRELVEGSNNTLIEFDSKVKSEARSSTIARKDSIYKKGGEKKTMLDYYLLCSKEEFKDKAEKYVEFYKHLGNLEDISGSKIETMKELAGDLVPLMSGSKKFASSDVKVISEKAIKYTNNLLIKRKPIEAWRSYEFVLKDGAKINGRAILENLNGKKQYDFLNPSEIKVLKMSYINQYVNNIEQIKVFLNKIFISISIVFNIDMNLIEEDKNATHPALSNTSIDKHPIAKKKIDSLISEHERE